MFTYVVIMIISFKIYEKLNDIHSDFNKLVSDYENDYPMVDLSVELEDDTITLSWIRFKKKFQGRGAGNNFLNKLTTFADQNDLKIMLDAWNWKQSTKERLENWYKKWGFNFESGHKKEMIRYPKTNENVSVPVKVGDTILRGKFKNVKVKVKKIGKDQRNQPTINGQKMLTFRMLSKAEKQKDKKLDK